MRTASEHHKIHQFLMNSVGESSNPKIVFYKIQYLNYYSCIIMASPQGNLEAIKENGKIYGLVFFSMHIFLNILQLQLSCITC